MVRARLPGRRARRSVRSPDRMRKCDSGRCRVTTACRGEGRLDDGRAHWELDQRRTRLSPRGAFRNTIVSRLLGNRFRFEVGWDCPGGARAWTMMTTTTTTTTMTTADNNTIGHVVSTGRIHNSRCQVVLRQSGISTVVGGQSVGSSYFCNGAEPSPLARFHRDFDS